MVGIVPNKPLQLDAGRHTGFARFNGSLQRPSQLNFAFGTFTWLDRILREDDLSLERWDNPDKRPSRVRLPVSWPTSYRAHFS